MKKINSLIALILINSLLFSDALEMTSSQLSASSAYYSTNKTTAIALSNPALTADIQRYTFDFNYLLLAGFSNVETGFGHTINLGGALPSKFGVLSSNINFILMDGFLNNELNFGNGAHININFSKEIYSDLYFGLGLTTLLGSKASFGTNTNYFDWGLGLNLGFVKKQGDIHTLLRDFRWGVSFKNIGKGYMHTNLLDSSAPVPFFTPAGFVEFSPFKNDFIHVNLASEVSLPSFMNLNLSLGAKAVILENIIVDTGLDFNIKEIVEGNLDRMVPSIFIGYDLALGKDTAQLNLSGNPYLKGVWAIGAGGTMPIGSKDTNPPKVIVDYSDLIYISPDFDGTSDELNIPIKVEDERYVTGYEFTIKDDFGYVVKRIKNKDERPENESFKNLFTKLISEKTGIPIPESFRWDGKKDNGELVPDGKYSMSAMFVDDNGNRTFTDKYEFVVDVTDPVLEIKKPSGLDLIFSPNGDGNKDVLKIEQSGSKEIHWYGEIKDFLGNTIKSEHWDNKDLTAFEWNGKDDSNQLVPDGVYQYRIVSTDLAGNSVEDFVDNIIVNTKQPPIGITISTNSFSPNSDGVKDFMEFILDIPVKTGIIEWNLLVKDRNGNVVNTFSTKKQGYSVIEDNIRFDGQDSSGKYLNEGTYTGVLNVTYQNGHSPKVISPEFSIDITPPKATVRADYKVFSPNGDNSKDQIIFSQNSSLEEEWFGEIFDEFGDSVYRVNWKGEIEKQFSWNGKNDKGELQKDGIYSYVLNSVDKSGNRYLGNPLVFTLDTTPSSVELAINKDAFSPYINSDEIIITPKIDSSSKLSKYSLEIVDKKSKIVNSLSTGFDISEDFIWNGTDDKGNKLSDDIYYGRINGEFENGNKIVALTAPILLDTKKPDVNVTLKEKYNIFSPNGDGQKDSLTFIQETSLEDSWVGEISNEDGDIVYSSSWSGNAPSEFVFNGKDKNNKKLNDGIYSYTLKSTDKAGNSGVSNNIKIQIDTENVDLFVATDISHFSPNGDGIKDSITFIPEIKKVDGIDTVRYEVLNKKGSVLFTKNISTNFTETVSWNGKDLNGKVLADDQYSVKLTVNYKRGDSPSASTDFTVDLIAPKAEVLTRNNIFSPNGDGNRDIVEIENRSSDSAEWTLTLKDSSNNIVKESVINGQVSNRWDFDGRGSNLAILPNGTYIYNLKAVDEAGNSFKSKDIKFTLDNTISTLVLSNDLEVFSPNNDKIKDNITFNVRVETTSEVESWKFDILDSKNSVIKSLTGTTIPKEIVWNGNNDVSKKIASDGLYKGKLSIVHKNGNNPVSITPSFELDTKYPEIDLSVKNELFSPNGDNLKDYVNIIQRGSGEDLYHGVITDSNKKMVNEWFWKGNLTALNWDGKDKSGNIAQDGVYSYLIESTDLGGNKTSKNITGIEIDTTETDIFITYKKPVFAPDLSKKLGGQIFGLIVNNKKGIDTWNITINNDKNVVKVLSGEGSVPDTVEWDGLDSNGKYTNGILTAKFNVIYKKGNSPVYLTKDFIADSEAPLINVSTSPTPFSPDNDFVDDELVIDLGVKDLSDIKSWKFEISDPKGNEFITFQGEGKPGNRIIWDGKSRTGELVQAAEEYQYSMSVIDAAGHTGLFNGDIPVDILVIKEGDKLKIKISSIIFEPNSSELVLSGTQGELNKKILKRLSEILNKYSSYKIGVEGHAHNIYGDKITNAQKTSLIDFSKERANAVKKTLTSLGISESRMTTIGIGGEQPIVGLTDYENTWKNRRVEFILVK